MKVEKLSRLESLSVALSRYGPSAISKKLARKWRTGEFMGKQLGSKYVSMSEFFLVNASEGKLRIYPLAH